MAEHKTEQQRASQMVDRMMHDAHLRYQQTMLRADTTHGTLPSSEVRGCHEQRRVAQVWRPEWSTHLRPNFWIAYFDTLTYMIK